MTPVGPVYRTSSFGQAEPTGGVKPAPHSLPLTPTYLPGTV
jgi:hypothetical protein